jgi:hypothetical protein
MKLFTKPKCDYCSEQAVVYYQRVWGRWRIYKSGKYSKHCKLPSDSQEQIGYGGVHLCKEHEKEALEGKI